MVKKKREVEKSIKSIRNEHEHIVVPKKEKPTVKKETPAPSKEGDDEWENF